MSFNLREDFTVKKKFLLILLALSTFLAGCGATPKEKAIKQKYSEIERSDSTISKEEAYRQAEEFIEKQGFYNEDGSMKTDEEIYKAPDKAYDWRYYESTDKAVQIDDLLLVPCTPLGDMMKQIEDAGIYSYEYNKDKITTYLHEEQIPIYKNSVLWFTIYAQSYFEDETVTIPNCLVTIIEPSEASLKYMRFVNGSLYEDFLEMDYDELIEFIDTYYPEPVWTRYETSGTYTTSDDVKHETVEFDIRQDSFYSIMNNTDWAGVRLSAITNTHFYVDADTNEVIDVKFAPATGWRIISDSEYESIYLNADNSTSEVTESEY